MDEICFYYICLFLRVEKNFIVIAVEVKFLDKIDLDG